MKLKLNFIQSVAAGALAVTAIAVGCQNPDYPAAQPSTAGPNTTQTRVLFVNATPDASSLKLSVDNIPVATLTPGASTSYVGVQSGSVANASPQIRVNGAGGSVLTSDVVTKALLAPNTAYTYFVTDSINRPKGTGTDLGGIRTLQVVDTLSVPATGTAKVRFYNLAPDVATVSARLVNSAGTSAATLNGRAYRTATGATLRYTSVPAGPYVTQVYSGTAVPTSLTATPAASTTLTLTDGKIYTIYTKGLNRAKTLSVGTLQHN